VAPAGTSRRNHAARSEVRTAVACRSPRTPEMPGSLRRPYLTLLVGPSQGTAPSPKRGVSQVR